jgi:hypothetical protein
VNNHYLTFGSQDEVTRVLDDAVTMGANVVRTFLQPVMDGLGAEGRCVREVLPRVVASDLRAAMRGKVGAAAEALSQHLLSRVRSGEHSRRRHRRCTESGGCGNCPR